MKNQDYDIREDSLFMPTQLVSCVALRNRRKTVVNYLTQKQINELIKDANEIAYVLFVFYLGKSATPDYDFKDERVAKALQWSVRKVAENRRLLQKRGWFKKLVITCPETKRSTLWIMLGKEECNKIPSYQDAMEQKANRIELMKILGIAKWEDIQGIEPSVVESARNYLVQRRIQKQYKPSEKELLAIKENQTALFGSLE